MATEQEKKLKEYLKELDKVIDKILDFYLYSIDRKTGKPIPKGNIQPPPELNGLLEKIEKLKKLLKLENT